MDEDRIESLEAFYRRKFSHMPANLPGEIGHFNLFRVEPPADQPRPVPYRRRDYFKIMWVEGQPGFLYADQEVDVARQALVFSSPLIPYQCTRLESMRGGMYCIFDRHFFSGHGDIEQYAVFRPEGHHVFELEDAQRDWVAEVFGRMHRTFESDYAHKYDLLRTLVYELVHFGMQLSPRSSLVRPSTSAAERLTALFLELLERQFPIEENHPQVRLRTPADFARQLNVHVNHLNRALKETTGKTTSRIIGERLAKEAQILLRYSPWQVKEIAWALGFTEVSHFHHFFKRYTGHTPGAYRKGVQG